MAKHTHIIEVTGWTLFVSGLSLALGLSLSFLLSAPKDRLLAGDCVTWDINLNEMTAERGIVEDVNSGKRKMIRNLSTEYGYTFKKPEDLTRIPNKFCVEIKNESRAR